MKRRTVSFMIPFVNRFGLWTAGFPGLVAAAAVIGAERAETFDVDPRWDAHNCRVTRRDARAVKQDFGYSDTAHCGGTRGEVGGFIQPVAEPAYYAKVISPRTLQDPLSASGTLLCEGRQLNALIGFFNAATLNEWRTPHTVALRIYGRGEVFYAYVEYATGKWRADAAEFSVADGTTGRPTVRTFRSHDAAHSWSLRYDPAGNGGLGTVTGRIDDQELVLNLDRGHRADGATFNRFGLVNVMKHYDSGGELWLDDLTINGETESFVRDPHWDGLNHRRSYETSDVRPWFDFGYSRTGFAGGKAGEIGGLIFRGDGRYPDRMAYYGDRLEALDLGRPLKAGGKVTLLRGVSDSDTLIGFFHSEHSLNSGNTDVYNSPPDFLGIRIGGPSREGFYFAPAYRIHGREEKAAEPAPYIYPDGTVHRWSLDYLPDAADGRGQIRVTLDGDAVRLDLGPGHQRLGAHFNRFGLITTHHDGNGQRVYLDDLSYTYTQN